MKNTRLANAFGFALGVAAIGLPFSASAVTLKTIVAPIYQLGSGSQVQVGHTVVASTDYNRLYAGGEFTAICAGDPLPVQGRNYQTAETLAGGTQQTVTVPLWHPGIINMTGFYSVSRGQTLQCTYNWVSKAEESGYSIGIGGINFQTGNGKREEGGSQPFVMRKPGLGGDDGSTCIP